MKRYTEGHAKCLCVVRKWAKGECLETIQTNMKKAHDRQKKYANQSRREVTFEIGDWVYLKVTAQKGKYE